MDQLDIMWHEDFSSDQSSIQWEPGCPLIVSALQIVRYRGNSQEYLLVHFRNVWSWEIVEFAWNGAVVFCDGSIQYIDKSHAGASIAPGIEVSSDIIKLNAPNIYSISVAVTMAATHGAYWSTRGTLSPHPIRYTLPWPENVLSARIAKLQKTGCRDAIAETWWNCQCGAGNKGEGNCWSCQRPAPFGPIPFDGYVQDFGSYWICACGMPNVNREECWSCRCSKEALQSTEDYGAIVSEMQEAAKQPAASAAAALDTPQRTLTPGEKPRDKASKGNKALALVAACAAVIVLLVLFNTSPVKPPEKGELPDVAHILAVADNWTYRDYAQALGEDNVQALVGVREEYSERCEHISAEYSDLSFDEHWAALNRSDYDDFLASVSFDVLQEGADEGRPMFAMTFREGYRSNPNFGDLSFSITPIGIFAIPSTWSWVSYDSDDPCYYGDAELLSGRYGSIREVLAIVDSLNACSYESRFLSRNTDEADAYILESLGFDEGSVVVRDRSTVTIPLEDGISAYDEVLSGVHGDAVHWNIGTLEFSFGTVQCAGKKFYYRIERRTNTWLAFDYVDLEERAIPPQVVLQPSEGSFVCVFISPDEETVSRQFEINRFGHESSGSDVSVDTPTAEQQPKEIDLDSIAAAQTPYYVMDVEKFATDYPSYAAFQFAYDDTFHNDDPAGGEGYALYAFCPESEGGELAFSVNCYSGDWKPDEENSASAFVGTTESAWYGSLSVFVVVHRNSPLVYGASVEGAQDIADRFAPYVSVSPASSEFGYVLAESDSRLYSSNELVALSDWQLFLARNEIFARHGRRFSNADLRAYFESCPWYDGQYDPDDFDSWFSPNEYEKVNADLIGEMERSRNSPYLN